MLHISAFEINDQEVEAAVPFEATPCTAESEIAGKEFGQGVAQKAKCLQSETCEMTVNVVTEGCGSRRKREADQRRRKLVVFTCVFGKRLTRLLKHGSTAGK